ncbi:hypothetical protein LTR95_003120 [Oleoguttula sp. CCFEE 5521]
MPSHLSRQVFRAIIANEPIVSRGCLRRVHTATSRAALNGSRHVTRQRSSPRVYGGEQRRTLFGLSLFRSKPPRDSKDVNYEPGIEKMMEYAKMERMRARLPPVEDIIQAWQQFIGVKKAKRDRIQDTQGVLLLQTLRYLRREAELQGEAVALDKEVLLRAAKRTSLEPVAQNAVYVELARELYECLSALPLSAENRALSFEWYLGALCSNGQTQQARELLLDQATAELRPEIDVAQDGLAAHGSSAMRSNTQQRLAVQWARILKGFARERNEEGLFATLGKMRELGLDTTSNRVAQIMIRHHMLTDDVEAVKHWWSVLRPHVLETSQERVDDEDPEKVLRRLLRWCMKTDNLQLGHSIVRDVVDRHPSKYIWDSVFLWAAGTKKSVDEIGRMLDVMETVNERISNHLTGEQRYADITTINLLVEYAISQNDPYMAERFITLGQQRKIEPNAKTFTLQMDYRLSVGDVDGALIAYKHLQSSDTQSYTGDISAVNHLIVALCGSKRHDFDTIMNVAADLSDRSARFEPITVSTLSILHLSRDEIHDVADLLNTHAYSYSSSERTLIRENLIAFSLDLKTQTSRAWDTYTLLRSIFDEMPRSERTGLMLSFFARHRPDMAVHVFQHMRAHSREDTIPNASTYISAFAGCAKLKDLESLEVVHNQLKLDYNLDVTTTMRNSLMLSYTACEMPRRALDFWDEIVASREGPSVSSVHAALRACEKSPFGDLKARDIWARLRRNRIELSTDLWASYIAALAGNGDNELAISALENAVEKGEVSLSGAKVERDGGIAEPADGGVLVMGSLYSAAPGQVKQQEIEAWARQQHPEVWERIEEVGWEEDENGMRAVRVERGVNP